MALLFYNKETKRSFTLKQGLILISLLLHISIEPEKESDVDSKQTNLLSGIYSIWYILYAILSLFLLIQWLYLKKIDNTSCTVCTNFHINFNLVRGVIMKNKYKGCKKGERQLNHLSITPNWTENVLALIKDKTFHLFSPCKTR